MCMCSAEADCFFHMYTRRAEVPMVAFVYLYNQIKMIIMDASRPCIAGLSLIMERTASQF